MLIECVSTLGKDLPSHVRVMGETDKTVFSPLVAGTQYEVYGLMFYTNRTDFLVCPSNYLPMWVPSHLFKVLDDELPEKWACVMTENTKGYSDLFESFGIHAICGYFELVRSYDHYVGILEREPEALQLFQYQNK